MAISFLFPSRQGAAVKNSTWITVLSLAVVAVVPASSLSASPRQKSVQDSLQAAINQLPTFTEFDKLGEGPFAVGVTSFSEGTFSCKSFSKETLTEFLKQEKMFLKLVPPRGFAGNSKVNIGLQIQSFSSPEECRMYKGQVERAMRQITGGR